MQVICPKCSHVRPPDASNPAWECPSCGICYARFVARPAALPRPVREAPVEVKQPWDWTPLLKIMLVVALGWGLNTYIERRNKPPLVEEAAIVERQEGGPAVKAADTVLRISGVDAGLLAQLAGRLEKSCARNKYGLSEQACVARFREREDGCARTTAQAFPGQIGDTRRMQVITQAYVGCIFENKEKPG